MLSQLYALKQEMLGRNEFYSFMENKKDQATEKLFDLSIWNLTLPSLLILQRIEFFES